MQVSSWLGVKSDIKVAFFGYPNFKSLGICSSRIIWKNQSIHAMKILSAILSAFAIAPVFAAPALADPIDVPIVATVYDANRILKDDKTAWFTGDNDLYVVRWSNGMTTRIQHVGEDVYLGDSEYQEQVVLQRGKGYYCFIGTFKLCIAPRKIGQ
jgi:hypothetical protein